MSENDENRKVVHVAAKTEVIHITKWSAVSAHVEADISVKGMGFQMNNTTMQSLFCILK